MFRERPVLYSIHFLKICAVWDIIINITKMCFEYFFIESDPYERFVIHKLISLELKLNSIERCQKLILKKISIETFEAKEKETIDIYQDLPLKTETDLQSMENKLNNDLLYRNEMVS